METIAGDAVLLVQAEREKQVRAALNQGTSWTLKQWEEYLNAINPNFMELGLKRVGTVAQRLQIQERLDTLGTKVVTVAGTNGKGSTCALVAQTMHNLGFKVGLYTSPHLIHFNERIQINGQNITDVSLCRCLNQVIQAQFVQEAEYIDLSYFEIITLASWLAFIESECEVLVLEIGLGGRLDAVNLVKHHVAIITSIGLDHMKILGDTVEKIAYEKAGIIHPQDYCIVGSNIPDSALDVIKGVAKQQGATFVQENCDFKVVPSNDSSNLESSSEIDESKIKSLEQWSHIGFSSNLINKTLSLDFPKVPFICTGPALQAVFYLMNKLNVKLDMVSQQGINKALSYVALPGRMQKVHSAPAIYLDVAHNVPAAQHLQVELKQHLGGYKRRLVVIGMLKDKDVEGVLKEIKDSFDAFYVASLHVPRGESKERLVSCLEQFKIIAPVVASETVAEALRLAKKDATSEDVIVVMGSFVTVAEAQQALDQQQ